MNDRELEKAVKFTKTLYKIQKGVLYSQKYERLFESHIKAVSIHEASHAVIATLLGVRVAMVEGRACVRKPVQGKGWS
jgi:hypothetical protein